MEWNPEWNTEWIRRRYEERILYQRYNWSVIDLPPFKKRHKAKAYEAPYQFPRDLMEAIEDYAQLYAIDGYADEFEQDKADAIWNQIEAWVKTIGG